MKKLLKGTKFVFPNDGIERKIIDIERYTDSNYVCYYVDIPFFNGDDFFEKNSIYYNEIIKTINL